MRLRIECLDGARILERVEQLADLRVTVFREFPYLYEGSRSYENRYLKLYAESPRAFVALAWDGDRAIGATTVLPLSDAPNDMQQPYVDAGRNLDEVDYFGESVVLREYRGQGLGSRFFELREDHAQKNGLSVCSFCAVERPADHPLRPSDYVPNDAFWSKRGYVKIPELRATFGWTDVGEAHSTKKPMVFWEKRIG